jgi:DNA-binding LacI/PurR family transcriptional regulator
MTQPPSKGSLNEILESLTLDADSKMTLALQLSQQLTWLVASGQVKAGERLPPVRELAKQLDINLHTVRAAYHKLEADGLVTMRQGTGTVVQLFDSVRFTQLTNRTRSYTFGLVIANISHPFYTALARGVEEVAHQNHALLFICNTNEDARKGREYLDRLAAKNVDGLIIASYSLHDGETHEATSTPRAAPVPLVHVDRPGETGYSVLLDYENAGYVATRHLIEHGHRRLGIIGCSLPSETQEPYHGYARALRAAGLMLDPAIRIEASAYTIEAGYLAATRLLAAPSPPTAIFCDDDTLAVGALRAIRESGRRVPDDVALAGCGDLELATTVDPRLTSVTAPGEQLGIVAMQMLQKLVAGEAVPTSRVTLPTYLAVRRSCGCEG